MTVADDQQQVRDVGKMTILRDHNGSIEGFLLPKDLTLSDLKRWTDRFMLGVERRSEYHLKRMERFEGRTYQEDWARPTSYQNISGNSGGSGASGGFDVGLRVLDLIETEGRHTIDEICYEIGAVDKEPLSIIVNNLRADHWLKDHTEHSGEHTLELTTREEHNELCRLPPPTKPKVVIMSCLPYLNKKEDTRYAEPAGVSL